MCRTESIPARAETQMCRTETIPARAETQMCRAETIPARAGIKMCRAESIPARAEMKMCRAESIPACAEIKSIQPKVFLHVQEWKWMGILHHITGRESMQYLIRYLLFSKLSKPAINMTK